MSDSSEFQAKIQEHRDWLRIDGGRTLKRDSLYLEADLKCGTVAALERLPASLNGLALHHGINGLVALVDGDPQGWQDLSASMDYYGLMVKARERLWTLKPEGVRASQNLNLTNSIEAAAGLACVSSRWLANGLVVLHKAATEPGAVDKGYWKSRVLEPFVLAAYRIAKGQSHASVDRGSPYAGLLLAWDQPEAGHALSEACEYHASCISKEAEKLEIRFPCPFDLLPIEVLLIRRLRAEANLPEVTVDHWLVRSFLLPKAEIPVFPQPDLVNQCEQWLKETWG